MQVALNASLCNDVMLEILLSSRWKSDVRGAWNRGKGGTGAKRIVTLVVKPLGGFVTSALAGFRKKWKHHQDSMKNQAPLPNVFVLEKKICVVLFWRLSNHFPSLTSSNSQFSPVSEHTELDQRYLTLFSLPGKKAHREISHFNQSEGELSLGWQIGIPSLRDPRKSQKGISQDWRFLWAFLFSFNDCDFITFLF